MALSRKFIRNASIGTIGLGGWLYLKTNNYDPASFGLLRLFRAAVTVFQIGSHYKNSLYKCNLDKKSPEYLNLKSKVHKHSAEKLLELCCVNKGVYIKVGQHIGALDYLLPQEYVSTMKVLHNSAPQSSFEDVLTVIKEDFKKDPYEIFESIDQVPLGTASLAQVHKAVLKDGRVVAVKVQHHSVKKNFYVDMKTMETLVKLTSIIFPDFNFDWLVNETKTNVPKELDFTKEGENAEKLQKYFAHCHWLKIPKIYWDFCSSRVLTMEYLDGGQINDLKYICKNNISAEEICNKLGYLYSHMIFTTGFVHSDPHPGNILVKQKGAEAEIILLDHGLYASLSNDFRLEYSKLWLAIMNGDKTAMKIHCKNLGVTDFYGILVCMVSGRSWNTIINGVQKTQYTKSENQFLQNEIQNILPQISSILQNIDRQMLLLFKTNDLIRGIEHSLKVETKMSGFLEMSRCCINSIYGEKIKQSNSKWSTIKFSIMKQWALIKLSMYYTYLSLINFDLNKQIESVWSSDLYL
ncbi:aarF domain-containing kinase 1-like [Prorops nasuta]|uniref:aarF domain-containing kinase 1-like n=1 Tax=Prorops nasuta TaxID=863751 RepID=UPI0034CD0628